jgi:hypothetical protein
VKVSLLGEFRGHGLWRGRIEGTDEVTTIGNAAHPQRLQRLDDFQPSLRDSIVLHDEPRTSVLGKVQPSLRDSIRQS